VDQPIPVLSLEYAGPALRYSVWPQIVRICHLIALLACVGSTLFIAFVDTQWGVLGGIPIFAAGMLAIVGAALVRDWWGLALGVCNVGVCLLFMLLVNLLTWSPDEAHMPFSIMGAVYTPLAGYVTWRTGAFRGTTTGPAATAAQAL
jgi:hypothetical protein